MDHRRVHRRSAVRVSPSTSLGAEFGKGPEVAEREPAYDFLAYAVRALGAIEGSESYRRQAPQHTPLVLLIGFTRIQGHD